MRVQRLSRPASPVTYSSTARTQVRHSSGSGALPRLHGAARHEVIRCTNDLDFKVSEFLQARLPMKNNGWYSGLLNQQPSSARVRRAAGAMTVVMLLATAGIAVAQDANPVAPAPEIGRASCRERV